MRGRGSSDPDSETKNLGCPFQFAIGKVMLTDPDEKLVETPSEAPIGTKNPSMSRQVKHP